MTFSKQYKTKRKSENCCHTNKKIQKSKVNESMRRAIYDIVDDFFQSRIIINRLR